MRGFPTTQAAEPRDPFVFGSREPSADAPTTPALVGILWDAHSPLALIDGEPVMTGQTVGGWQLIAIHPDSIVLQRDSQRLTLAPGDHLPAE